MKDGRLAEEAGGARGGEGAAAGGASAEEAEGAGAPLQRPALPAAVPPAVRAPGGLRHQRWLPPRPLLPGPPPTASNRLSWCFRSAGVLQWTGEGRTRLRFRGTQEPEQRAAGQEEEDGPVLVGGGGWVQTSRFFYPQSSELHQNFLSSSF